MSDERDSSNELPGRPRKPGKLRERARRTDSKPQLVEAAKFIPLDQLAISPQCGFASDVVGNLLSKDDQRRKLERVVETARQVWG